MRKRQLMLIDATRDEMATQAASGPVERLFEHWVFMMGKSPRRCALGPKRRKVVAQALELYDEETLMLAIEGCAASAWHAGENDRGVEFNDLELIFRDEPHVERFVADGERLRERAVELARPRAEVVALPAAEDEGARAAARQRVRDLALRISGRGRP